MKDLESAAPDWDCPAFRAQAGLINLIKPDKLVICDVGANVGQAYQIYRHLFPGARIFCFEPFPESCTTLRRLVEADRLCSVHQLALSCHSGLADFNVNSNSQTNSLLPTAPSSSRFWGEGLLETSDVIQVEKTTLDTFIESSVENHVSILKLDVQGGEYDVLLGASHLFGNHAVDIVYLEIIISPTYVKQHLLHDYFKFFYDRGYVFIDFYNPHRTGFLLNQVDAIFVSRSVYELCLS